jgi:DNA-binding MarR family transcriptional regulator
MAERMAVMVMSQRSSVRRGNTAAQVSAQLGDAITRLNRRLRQARPVGELTQNQISVLTSLELAGALTPRELADAERVAPPTMTKVLAKLEERGLLQRSPHPTDGRQVILSATEAGRAVIAEQRRAKDQWLTRVLAELPAAERETLARAAEILNRISRKSG